MRAIFLIARREYLSYVATWGFWLSLLAVPIFATIGASIPALIENSQPIRYFAVIDETGQGLEQVIRERRAEARREDIRDQIERTASFTGDDAVVEAALAAFDTDPDGLEGLDAAIEAMGVPGMEGAIDVDAREAVMVSAPGATLDDLRPYVTGDQMIDTPDGPRPLFAAFAIRPSVDRPLEVVYLSENLTNRDLRNEVVRVLRAHVRDQALLERGLSPDEIDRLLSLSPKVTSLNASPDAEADAEVTVQDSAPFVIAILLGFILWLAVFSVANMLLTSLIEEKGGKIIEVLLSTARFHEILIGKLAGVAGVSLTLFVIWGFVGSVLAALGGAALASINPEIAEFIGAIFDPVLLGAALIFFIAGYLMYGAIFLAMGSLCDTLQDAQTLMGPVIWTLMLPLLFLFFSLEASDSMVVRVASWVPLWTPFIMMARLPAEPPLWELLGAGTLMVVTTIVVLWAAAAVFRQGALRQADADSVRRFFKFGRKKA
jgi:ABC-2 type transport system permease protein